MKLMKYSVYLLLLLLFIQVSAFAQTAIRPAVGRPMPDFSLNNITHYKTSGVSLNDFKGKWLFLDFWTLTCKTCIASFPKINILQDEFSDSVQYVMVGACDKKYNNGIENVYEKFRKKFDLRLTTAYDSVLFKKWEIGSVPHIYIIDPDGILRFITDGRDMTSEKIHSMLKGETVSFYAKDAERTEFDGMANQISLLPADKILFSSILTGWNGEKQSSGYGIDGFIRLPKEERSKGWSVAMIPLYAMYNYAYLGKWDWFPSDTLRYGKIAANPILEIKDSSFFRFDYINDVGKGTYNYYLKVPDGMLTAENLMSEIQRSLASVFGYSVSVEMRKMPVWKLTSISNAVKNLRTKGGPTYRSKSDVSIGFELRNCSIKDVLNILIFNLPNKDEIPYIDDTGISTNIDIKVDAVMRDYEDVRKILIKYGLDLVKGEKEMKVLVIRDPKK